MSVADRFLLYAPKLILVIILLIGLILIAGAADAARAAWRRWWTDREAGLLKEGKEPPARNDSRPAEQLGGRPD